MSSQHHDRALRVRACIPHFVDEAGDRRYGSGQPDARQARALALGRCLGALLDLQRSREDSLLQVGSRTIQRLNGSLSQGTATALPPLSLDLTVCTDGLHQLDGVLAQFAGELTVRQLNVADPRHLALASRNLLLGRPDSAPLPPPPPVDLVGAAPGQGAQGEQAVIDAPDLYLYLEDDLVIRDPLYLDKMDWFLRAAADAWVLMPQRYERLSRQGLGVMLVDGDLRPPALHPHTPDLPPQLAHCRFPWGETLELAIPANPHAGSFCLSRNQVKQLRSLPLPDEGFVGPLETAATLTVLQHFPVLKPLPQQWRGLAVEHGHPAFRRLQGQLPEFQVLAGSGASHHSGGLGR